MAHDIQVIKELDGNHRGIARVVITSDGEAADLVGEVILDSSALQGGRPITQILSIEYSTVGTSCTLSFDGSTDIPIVVIPADDHGKFCFKKSQLPNTATNKTGDIILSTSGLDTDGSAIMLRIAYKKERK